MTSLALRLQVVPGEPMRLDDRDPSDTCGLDRAAAEILFAKGAERLAELQERMFAQRRWAALLVLQGLDASGKDGAIRRLAAGLSPMTLRVTAFGAPSALEQAHDFLWRVHRAVPPRGTIGVFNRSHYEDVLVPRVDEAARARLSLPRERMNAGLWNRRLAAITAFEGGLADEGTVIAKVFLDVSHEEQRKRLLARIDDPSKHWKYDTGDLDVRDRRDEFRRAYEQAIAATNTPGAPWYVVPADRKWFARVAVQQVLLTTLEGVDLTVPPPGAATLAAMQAARERLKG